MAALLLLAADVRLAHSAGARCCLVHLSTATHLVPSPQARDFDPHSLRAMLPAAVAALEHAKQSGGK